MKLFCRREIDEESCSEWALKAFDAFERILVDRERQFPCTFGISGFKANQLRFCFVDADPASRFGIEHAAAALQSYLPMARAAGSNTSLVLFFNETADLGVDVCREIFWALLNGMRQLDSRPWPESIPVETEADRWEFSFAGEPVFVVCNTPSHKQRLSRFGSAFTLTFQPRWVFEGIVGPLAPNGLAVKNQIRSRLSRYDSVPVSRHLGEFGALGNREWKQYFLSDGVEETGSSCPMTARPRVANPWVVGTGASDLQGVVSQLLPPTGSVEVQVDTPHRIHPVHSHDSDETLHIISGSIIFKVGEETFDCGPGDRLMLPAHISHASEAGPAGCIYVIASRLVDYETKRSPFLEAL